MPAKTEIASIGVKFGGCGINLKNAKATRVTTANNL